MKKKKSTKPKQEICMEQTEEICMERPEEISKKPLGTVLREKAIWLWKSSLLVQSGRICVVLFLFLLALFYWMPKDGSFSAEIVTDNIGKTTGKISVADIDAEIVEFFVDGPLAFEADSMIVNGKQYYCKDDAYISINPEKNEDINIRIKSENNSRDINCFSVLGGTESSVLGYSLPPLLLYSTKEEAEEFAKNRMNISVDGSVVISSKQCFTLEILNSNAVIHRIDENMVSDVDDHNDDLELENPFINTIVFPNGVKEISCMLGGYNSYFFSNPHVNKIDMNNIAHINALEGNGEISVSYKAEPEVHLLKRQDLEIESNKSAISATIQSRDDDLYSMSMAGYADSISLSKNGLLPSFMNWFKGNVYLLPTTFVTMIVGAITLIKMYKDEDKKKKEEVSSKKEPA